MNLDIEDAINDRRRPPVGRRMAIELANGGGVMVMGRHSCQDYQIALRNGRIPSARR